MTINLWGRETQNPLAINADAGAQQGPAVADLGFAEFAVAWIDGTSVQLKFFDEQGNINPAFPQVVVSDATSANITELQLAGGGSGMGYGVAWSETNAGADQLKLRYYNAVAGAVFGNEIAISSNVGVAQHDLELSAYAKDDAGGRPIVDGIDAVWVEGAGGAHSLGAIFVQRFAVPLDARRDPSGPPTAAGIDGAVGTGSDTQLQIAANGRDPSIAGLHAHVGGLDETIVTFIDAANNINIQAYNNAGTLLNTITGVTQTNVNSAGRPLAAGTQQHVAALQGGGFVVAWVSNSGGGNNVLVGRVFTPGAAGGAWTAGPAIVLDTLDGASNSITDFKVSTLETDGFSVSWTAADSGTQGVFSRTYTNGGIANEDSASVFHAAGDATNVATSGLIGDRFVAVYQHNGIDGGDIGARILDPRFNTVGDPITLNGPGISLLGDPDFEARGRIAPDILVGTIGQDTIDGRQSDDILDGSLGDDVIVAGLGNDTIDGGGGTDTLVLSGRFTIDGNAANDDYTLDYLGGGLFQITDNRAATVGDGIDFARSIENFEFLGSNTNFTLTDLLGIESTEITPTAWGWTNEDADNAPNADGTPDVDGFIINPAANAGIQKNISISDSVGEFIAVAWEQAATPGGDTRIRGQFFDVVLAPDGFIPNTMDLSDGIGIETNVAIASGGANSGWGFVFEQRDNAGDTTRELRTNFMGPGQLTSVELSVLAEAGVDQHDAAIFGSFLDRTLANPVGGSALPTGMNEGYNVAWVSTHAGSVDGVLDAGYGRIMLQRFEAVLDPLGNPGAPQAGGIDGIVGLDNAYGTGDNAVWIGDEDANDVGGIFGRNPSTSSLHTNEAGIVWISKDGAGEKVMFRAYDDLGQVIDYPAGNNLSAGHPVAAGTNAHIVSAGAVNFAIVWITADPTSPSGYTVMGTMLSSAGNGLDGVGFGFGAPAEPFVLTQLPDGFNPANSDFQAAGLSGEDSNDLALSWTVTVAGQGTNMQAQHIATVLDPVTGIALNMHTEGDIITVNAETAGNQSGGGIAGLLGDRFVAVFEDNNPAYTDGADLVARVIDTRDQVNPDPIIGDLIQVGGRVQARRDVQVGTNGNDNIRGDILDNDGLVDWIFAGMGDDIVQGGPGTVGAAGIPEIIEGGEGEDTAVYTGRLQDYSITLNGDGSYEVIDLRPVQGANNTLLNHDGIDNLFNFENIKFLDLSNGGASAQTIAFGFPGQPPVIDPSYDGTPVAWSLDDTSAYKEVSVDTDATPLDMADRPAGINVTNLQDGAGLVWTKNGNQVWAIAYDTTGKPDPILLGANTQLTSGAYSNNVVSDIDVAMTGGLGMTAVWESSDAGDSSIHLAFASTNTHVVLDPAGGVPGPGLPGGELVVVGTNGAGLAVDPVIQGYEIVDSTNATLEVGFQVGFALKDDGALDTNTGDNYGALMLARYEMPVYDILVDGAGLPILDGAGQGQLATDAFGNFIPSTTATFGVGAETAPISLGLDGLRGTADDGQAIALTDLGLFAADAVPLNANVLQGRDLTMGSLHDGQLVVSYIGTDERVHLKVYLPTVDEFADRETGGLDVDVVAQGVTTYSEFPIPFPTTLGAVAPGSTAMTVPQQNGSFGVFWGESNGAGGLNVKGVIYSGAGSNWSPSQVFTFASGLPAASAFQVASAGVAPSGLEDGFFVSWESAGAGVLGQRFNMAGETVGQQIVVGDPTTGTPTLHSTTGIDDGRMLVGYVDGTGVSAQFLDNRQPGVALIGPRTGAPADVIVGTVGDDAIDGRRLNDQLSGGLGDDFITLGSGADIGFGGEGNDTILGGTGQDQLLGEAGDDLLWGGLSGPIDPQVDRDLVTSLTALGVSAALIASDPGADIISGGAGNDTISYQGEFGDFNVNLTTGIVTSDRAHTGTFILEDVIGELTTNAGGAVTFAFTGDIENATGGLGDDTLVGDANANVLSGREGSNSYDGLGGIDTAVLDGNLAAFTFARTGNSLFLTKGLDVQTVINTEFLQFADRRISVADVFGVLPTGAAISGAALIVPDANQAPTAADDTAAVLQGSAVLIKALANDTDPDGGQTLFISHIEGAPLGSNSMPVADGVVKLLSNGALLFTPNATFLGTTSFDYTASDGMGGTSIATVTIDVTPAALTGPASLSVTGVAAEHGVLVAVLGPDPDGNGTTPDFQWYRDGVAIAGETSDAHAITLADIGSALSVRASYTDAKGNAEAIDSAPTGLVAAVNDGASAVSIAGTVAEHQTLTAVVGLDPDGAGSTPTLQWLRNGAAIAGATSQSYVLATADVGANISLRVSYTDSQGFAEVVTSAATVPVVAVNDGQTAVSISGSALEHQLLTAVEGNDPDGNGTLSYQWFRGVNAISGATLATYTTQTADVGAAISVRVSYIDGQGFSEAVTSTATASIAAVNDGQAALSITGAARVGQTLTRVLGNDPDGAGLLPVSLQWLKDGQVIVGQTGATYTLTAGDELASISVRASYTDGQGFAEAIESTSVGPVGRTIGGTSAADALVGSAGNDLITALGGNDTITGNAGNDTVNAGAGADTVVGTVGDGNDTYDGALGVDTYTLAATSADAVVNLQLGLASSAQTGSDTLANFENVIGGSGNDTLTGDAQTNRITGGAGNDTLSGGTGGTDTLVGGIGDDIYIMDSSGVSITEVANEGIDTVRTGLASYTLTGSLGGNVENLVYTGAANFAGTGNILNNAITGGVGNDQLSGLNGDDVLTGGDGVDSLNGGGGADTLIGGAGADSIDTGFANDNVADLIRYFAANEFGDTVTNFDATGSATQVDRVQFGGALNAAFDDIGTDDDLLAWATGNGVNGGNTAVNLNTTVEALLLSGANNEGVVSNALSNAAAVAAEFNAEFAITAAVGQDALLVINDTNGNNFSVWQWVQGATGGLEIDTNELTLIGTFTANGTVNASMFDIIPGG